MKVPFNKRGSILGAFLLSLVAFGQTAPSNSSAKPAPVTVAFFVLDHKNHPITDIQQSDLTILDNKKPVPSILFLKKSSEVPLRLGLMIDASNSQRMSSLYQPLVKGASDLLNQILRGPDDKVAVFKVSKELSPSPLMSRHDLTSYKIDITPQGGTALYDGVAAASDQLSKVDTPSLTRRMLVLLSDGDDNLSKVDREGALDAALKAGIIIFAVSTRDDSASIHFSREKGNNALRHFAEKTGGEVFLHLQTKDAEKTFAKIQEQIEGMYIVSFVPEESGDNGFHRIELRVSGREKSRLRAPIGYYLK